jgi:hypothetical protein
MSKTSEKTMEKLVVMLPAEAMAELQRRKDEMGAPCGVQARHMVERALGLRKDSHEEAPINLHRRKGDKPQPQEPQAKEKP